MKEMRVFVTAFFAFSVAVLALIALCILLAGQMIP